MSIFNLKNHYIALKVRFTLQYPDLTEEELNCNHVGMKLKMMKNFHRKPGETHEEMFEII
jgi:hypothetical protein